MPTSTEPRKTYTPAQIEKMAQQVRTSIIEDMSDSSFLAPADMVCKLFIKRMKEAIGR